MRLFLHILAIVAAGMAAGGAARAQCTPSFDASPGVPGFDLEVYAYRRFDAGQGEQLYAGGRFRTFGDTPISGLARWTGTTWEPVGSGLLGGPVPSIRAMFVYDDGTGESLYLGGDFSSIDGVAAAGIARFDGTHFHAVGSGLPLRVVYSLAVFDAGSGSRLHAGTTFGVTTPGGVFRFESGTWSIVAGGVDEQSPSTTGDVLALEVYDAGAGAELYAGGRFRTAGGQPASYIARYDGATWHDVGGGVNEPVHAMATFDDGHGEQLYCGGTFLNAGVTVHPGLPAVHAARWNGQVWSNLGNTDFSAFFGIISALEVFDDGTGPALYLGGVNAIGPSQIFRFNGGPTWDLLPTIYTGRVLALRSIPSGSAHDLFLGGSLNKIGTVPVGSAARYRGCMPSGWTDAGSALPGAAGKPLLVGTGTLAAGSSNAADLSNASPSAQAGLFVAFTSTPASFKGGTLLPLPAALVLFTVTSPAGGSAQHFVMPAGVPAGTALWLQWAIQDAGAVQGVALSNAIRGITPS